jgi:hypothetical protein
MTEDYALHEHGGRARQVRGKWRCGSSGGCGHRLWIGGIPPAQSRDLPVWTWPLELIDRFLAIRLP